MIRSACLIWLMSVLPSHASFIGWDQTEEDETAARSWTSASLAWAQSIHPGSPSTSWVSAQTPPPREMWCLPQDPWAESCVDFDALMTAWLLSYLPSGTSTSSLPAFPKECASSCNTW